VPLCLPDNSPFISPNSGNFDKGNMLGRSRSDYWGKKHWVRRELEARLVGDYTTNLVRRSVERAEKWAETTDFLPFCRERDGVGRLLSQRISLKRPVVKKAGRESAVCTEKKLKRSLRLLAKTGSVVPAVGTYMPADSWVKKSFRTVPGHHKVLSLPVEPSVGPVYSFQVSNTVSAVSSPKHVHKDNKSHMQEVRLKGRNDFGALQLQGLPSELRENGSLRAIYAARVQAMARFQTVSKKVFRRFRSCFPTM